MERRLLELQLFYNVTISTKIQLITEKVQNIEEHHSTQKNTVISHIQWSVNCLHSLKYSKIEVGTFIILFHVLFYHLGSFLVVLPPQSFSSPKLCSAAAPHPISCS